MGSPLSLVAMAAGFDLSLITGASLLLWLLSGEVGRPLSLRNFMWGGVTLSTATAGRDWSVSSILFSKSSSERQFMDAKFETTKINNYCETSSLN